MPPYSFLLRSPFNPAALVISTTTSTNSFTHFQLCTPVKIVSRTLLARAAVSGNNFVNGDHSSVILDSLRVLQWDQLCDSVASFAGTSLGAKATKEQLWNLDKSYEDSMRLLEETNAAVEMQKYGAMMDFTGIDVSLVGTCIQCAHRSSPVSGVEAVALVTLLQFVETLQSNLKAAINEDSDWLLKFMPLAEMVMELMINGSLMKFIEQLVDEDGSIKDSASSSLRQARNQVRFLERKLYQLMESMIRNEITESSAEVCNVDGRWCIQSQADTRPAFEGLLLSSGSGAGNVVEPLSAVPLNDELQQARASVAKAEADVLLKITHKMQEDLNDIENLFNIMIRIDAINARARYSLSFGGACPDLYLPQDKDGILQLDQDKSSEDKSSIPSPPSQKTWTLYLPKANHPLLLLQHRQNLQMAMKDLRNANADIRRKKQQGGFSKLKNDTSLNLPSLEMQIAKLKQAVPVPFDIFIAQKTRVLLITGPNTGGKTICLKTVGLAAMMAKSGLYVLASEPARIPWFDFVLADIGDEQSLSQSLSTFSGHLKQISEIKSLSTNLSLVLVDEVGAGTNPLEGAALGMSLLESFADAGALLTIASTHHGELKTLKYSNDAFENACMEFDEVNLKPTYRILWGVPGRSNAINIAERLGLPVDILENARELYGAASAEMNEVIVDMEKFKQDYHDNIQESQHYLRHSKDLHQQLMLTKNRVMKHTTEQIYKMLKEISEAASSARSILHSKVRQSRLAQPSHQIKENKATVEDSKSVETTVVEHPLENNTKQSIPERRLELPKIGDTVNVVSINKKAVVLKLDVSKDEIVVQSGFLKLKLKLSDIVI